MGPASQHRVYISEKTEFNRQPEVTTAECARHHTNYLGPL